MSRQVMPSVCAAARPRRWRWLASVLAAQHAEEFYELVGEGKISFRRGALLRGAAAPSPAFSLFGFWKLQYIRPLPR
jgi:hypothetical protein